MEQLWNYDVVGPKNYFDYHFEWLQEAENLHKKQLPNPLGHKGY